jgi:hypothetical protein
MVGGGRLDDAAGAHVVVLADRAGADGEWHGDAALERLRRVLAVAPRAVLVFAGARQASLLGLAHRELRVPRERLVGTAPEALASAVRALARAARRRVAGEVASRCSAPRPAGCSAGTTPTRPAPARLHPVGAAEMPAWRRAGRRAGRRAVHAGIGCRARGRGVASHSRPGASRVRGARRRVRGAGCGVGRAGHAGPRGVQQVHTPALSAREQVALQVGPAFPLSRGAPAPAVARRRRNHVQPHAPRRPVGHDARRRIGTHRKSSRDLASQVSEARYLEHVKYLASDELGGRGNGTPGLERAARYIADQFRAAGLQPGVGDGSWFQPFEIVTGLDVHAGNTLVLRRGGRDSTFSLGDTYYPLSVGAHAGTRSPR